MVGAATTETRIPVILSWQIIKDGHCFVCKRSREHMAVIEVGLERLTLDENCLHQFAGVLAEFTDEFGAVEHGYSEYRKN